METAKVYTLAQVVLPSEVLNYYEIVGVDSTPTEIHIKLDEKPCKEYLDTKGMESNGFDTERLVTDFPARDHKVILKIRRRRWIDNYCCPVKLLQGYRSN